ncbi:histidine kinase [Thioploca ingrica]|uniref:histidine kinase n=1 Tax=Thioploca ingrica TaxID=40754 RepID=A0A090AJJ9_9GAMM|nr:histidine kinase [Thioploca ingrica]
MNLKKRRALKKQQKQLRKMRQSQPKSAKEYLDRGVLYFNKGKYELALNDYDEAIKLEPDCALAYYNNRGNIYIKQQKYELALNDLNQAIVLRPDLAGPYLNRGYLYYAIGKYELAAKDYEKVIDLDPKLAEQHYVLALIKGISYALKIEKDYQAEVGESNRFKYLSSMATAVAHEINQPVGIIRAATSAALADIQDNLFQPTELEPLLDKIYAQTDRLKTIIESFRKFANGDRQHREKVNLNQVVAQTIAIFGAQFKHHNIELTAALAETPPEPIAWANPFQLEEVLINLLNNAKDALEGFANPQVWIKTGRTITGATEIQVEDNGPGIAPEFLEKLFMPFESTKPTERGTGLGLHISRKIIEALGGTLNYTPRPGGGAAFNITFPPLSESEEFNNG